MHTVHIEGNVPADLYHRFVAASGEESGDELLARALTAFIADREWRTAVEEGLRQAEAGEGYPHEQVMEEMEEWISEAASRSS